MNPIDEPRKQPPVLYFDRIEIERRRHERREQEHRMRVQRRRRTAGIGAAVLIVLCAAGVLASALTGAQNMKVVRLIVTQPLGSTPVPTTTVAAATTTPVGSGGVALSGGASAPKPSGAGSGGTSGTARHSSSGSAAGLNVQAAVQAARAASRSGTQVGFAVFNSDGEELGAYADSIQNYGASITKAMLLVAYLRQVGSGQISAGADEVLTAMIEASDNASADTVYRLLGNPEAQIERVASDAGMTGFQYDTSDPVYVLGQSKVTAHDFALFFARIGQLIPAAQRGYGLHLLSNLDYSDQVGLLQSGLPGTVYSKEGWKPEGGAYVVNQAAQFQTHGVTYGVAVTVFAPGGSQTGNQAIIQRIGSALVG